MDPESDLKLHKALFEYTKDKALLVITHRLENIHEYDMIYVMHKGEVVEAGTYQELKQIKNGFFEN
jgi:ABC-type multidrug transport system fused ATPase/permease subunit